MEITPTSLRYLFNTFDLRFQEVYIKQRQPWWPDVAMEMSSSTEFTTHAWMEIVPTLRKWVGERVVNNIIGRSYQIINEAYELTLKVDRFKIEDDTYDLYGKHVDYMAEQAARWPNVMVSQAMIAGQTTACYDEQNFFSATHPRRVGEVGSPTYSNYDTTTATAALTATNYRTKRAEMMSFLGYDGLPLGVMPDLLVVPPQLEYQGRLILNADMIPSSLGTAAGQAAETNVLKGSAKLMVIPELAVEPTAWYLLDTTRTIKPFIWQLRQAPQFVYRTALDAENVFRRHEFEMGVDARGNTGYSLPFLAAKYVG